MDNIDLNVVILGISWYYHLPVSILKICKNTVPFLCAEACNGLLFFFLLLLSKPETEQVTFCNARSLCLFRFFFYEFFYNYICRYVGDATYLMLNWVGLQDFLRKKF